MPAQVCLVYLVIGTIKPQNLCAVLLVSLLLDTNGWAVVPAYARLCVGREERDTCSMGYKQEGHRLFLVHTLTWEQHDRIQVGRENGPCLT